MPERDPWQLYRIEWRLILLQKQLDRLDSDRVKWLTRRLDAATDSLGATVKATPPPK